MMTPEACKQMFGCSMEDLEEMKSDILGDPMIFAMGIISDAQELLARDRLEESRQVMNRAKWLMSKIWGKLQEQGVYVKLN